MKMNNSAYRVLTGLIANVLTELDKPIDEFAQAYKTDGLTNKRFRWDILWAIPPKSRRDWFKIHGIYDYLDDSHIDTALRSVCRELKIPQNLEA